MSSIRIALVCVAAPIALTAQGPFPPAGPAAPKAPATLAPREVPVAVAGCVNGRSLTPRAAGKAELPTLLLNASEFQLEGSRELIQQIRREHQGHYDEIEGIAVVPDGATADVETRQVGTRARIVVGRRFSTASLDPPKPVRLKVASLTHLSNTCTPS